MGVLVLSDQELHLDGEETGFECDVGAPGYFFQASNYYLSYAITKEPNLFLN
jgi:hypothetical protein